MTVLYILAFFTAAGAAWQDLHFRKVSNRYLAICLGLTILLYICLEIDIVVFTRNLILKNMADMVVDMTIKMAMGMAVPVLLLGWAFLLRKIGAGDIKLLAVLGAMMGPEWILNCMLWTCLIALAIEGIKWSIRHFAYSLWRNKKNPEEKPEIQCLANVRKRGIPLALPVFLATVSGICGMY